MVESGEWDKRGKSVSNAFMHTQLKNQSIMKKCTCIKLLKFILYISTRFIFFLFPSCHYSIYVQCYNHSKILWLSSLKITYHTILQVYIYIYIYILIYVFSWIYTYLYWYLSIYVELENIKSFYNLQI